MRGAIEAAPEAELIGVGPVALTLPRARLVQADGRRQEWQHPVLPRYARRTATLDATLARLYLCGASTRDLRRAVAPLFGSRAMSKSAISSTRMNLDTGASVAHY